MTDLNSKSNRVFKANKFLLLFYNLVLLFIIDFIVLTVLMPVTISYKKFIFAFAVHLACIVIAYFIFRVTRQVWRFGSPSSYIRLIMANGFALIAFAAIMKLIPRTRNISFLYMLAAGAIHLVVSVFFLLCYQHCYSTAVRGGKTAKFCSNIIYVLSGFHTHPNKKVLSPANSNKIKIAIIGAGRAGVGLCEELMNNELSPYIPICFVDSDPNKIGRSIREIPIYGESSSIVATMVNLGIQEIVFAIPDADASTRKELYNLYRTTGCKIKIYDYPTIHASLGSKRELREFDIEELLFREPIVIKNDLRKQYYSGKTVLITGGGGSIGSELCRQLSKMNPKLIVIVDVYENGAYDVQQELKLAYPNLRVKVEILSVIDKPALEKVFDTYRPQIVLHAAAHKHVPLMERNCCEAIKNNVFGTLNTVLASEKYGVEHFIMVSTDKAVNPTNVMGATKRMCEMIVLCHARMQNKTVFTATRFGNVLGSAGSVIPLFRRQIAAGGPVTLTDKRIIRYFMTIPEASQLVLESGAMAKNGELFCLDMGNPIKILDLAENMIRLSGYVPGRDIEIIETGLRPGEKLYEELLIHTEDQQKTDNDLIFIEKDPPITPEELADKLSQLAHALETNDDVIAKEALKRAVPTFRSPDEVNIKAFESAEMKIAETSEVRILGS